MIWISTLCLLALAGWLFFNALNERRWVEAHNHDESVTSDQGLFSWFTNRIGKGLTDIEGQVSISQENSRFARAVSKVQEKTGKWGDKFIESKASAARFDNDADRPKSAAEENTLFGRAVARISEESKRIDDKFTAKVKARYGQNVSEGSDEGLLTRTSRKVAAKSDEIGHLVADKAKNLSQGYAKGRSSVSDGKMTSGTASTQPGVSEAEDLLTRVASKVGASVKQMEKKLVKSTDSAS